MKPTKQTKATSNTCASPRCREPSRQAQQANRNTNNARKRYQLKLDSLQVSGFSPSRGRQNGARYFGVGYLRWSLDQL